MEFKFGTMLWKWTKKVVILHWSKSTEIEFKVPNVNSMQGTCVCSEVLIDMLISLVFTFTLTLFGLIVVGFKKLLHLLISKGVEVDAKYDFGTPLQRAAGKSNHANVSKINCLFVSSKSYILISI